MSGELAPADQAAPQKKRKSKRTTPTRRSLELLRERGYTCAVVEKFVRFPPPGHLVDLFGFIDLLAIRAGEVLAVQTTGDHGGDVQRRVRKIAASPHVTTVLSAGIKIAVHGWAKRGAAGARKQWVCRELPLTAESFAAAWKA